MAKMGLTFNGFREMAARIDEIGGDAYLHRAVNEALTETQKIIQNNVEQAAAIYARKGGGQKGYATGEMWRAVKRNVQIEWIGSIAVVHVGFDLNIPGGFHSIFVMYGTPRMQKDTKLYNAIFGAKTKKQIAEKQKEVLAKYIGL